MGWCYKPTVDYIDSRAFDLLSYEVQTSGDVYEPLSLSDYHQTFTVKKDVHTGRAKFSNFVISKGTRYNFEATGHHVTVKMPWHIVTSCNRALHIFYVRKYDSWVYSYDSAIQEAAHSIMHI